MKGIVFTAFFDLVEEKFSLELLDKIIEEAKLPSGGAYASAGTYPHEELVAVVLGLSRETGIPVPDLLRTFGQHLADVFSKKFADFFTAHKEPLDFLAGVDGYVHVEVRKLYSEAELPRFFCERPNTDTLIMDYVSGRHFEDVAQGLIEGVLKHYGCTASITRGPSPTHLGKDAVRFTIVLTPRS